MNNVIMRKIIVTSEYQPLSSKKGEVASVEISASPNNTGVVFFRGDDGSDVSWLPGEYHSLNRVNISELFLKGTPGDVVTIIGGTW